MQTQKLKFVYILPEFRRDIATHFYHKAEMLERLCDEFDLFLVVERGEAPEGFANVYVQYFRWLPLRVLELFSIFLALRLSGYRRFWTHYSFIAGNLAPWFGKSFYWNCGMPWLYRRGRIEEFFFRRTMKKNILVTGTEGMKAAYIKEYRLNAGRVRVVPNGINLERYIPWRTRRTEARTQLGVTSEQKVVLFVHRLSERKGAGRIKPIAERFTNDSNVLFVVAGSGPLAHEVIGGNIRRVGDIPQDKIPLYMAAADVFLMPSEEEGFPHVLLEAMAIGVPIVASDVGGVREIVPPVVQAFVISGDDDAFAQKIKALFDNSALMAQIAQEEKEWVTRFDSPEMVRTFTALVEETRG
ncbi:MAG: glycosyltransferase family 4 protein [Patescibacteria group bacterium]